MDYSMIIGGDITGISPLNREDLPSVEEKYTPPCVMDVETAPINPVSDNENRIPTIPSLLEIETTPTYPMNNFRPWHNSAYSRLHSHQSLTNDSNNGWRMHQVQRNNSFRTHRNWGFGQSWMLPPRMQNIQRGWSNHFDRTAGSWSERQLALVKHREALLYIQHADLLQEQELLKQQKQHLLGLEQRRKRFQQMPMSNGYKDTNELLNVTVNVANSPTKRNDVGVALTKSDKKRLKAKASSSMLSIKSTENTVSQTFVMQPTTTMTRLPSAVDVILDQDTTTSVDDILTAPAQTSVTLNERFTKTVMTTVHRKIVVH